MNEPPIDETGHKGSVGFDPRCEKCGAQLPMGNKVGECKACGGYDPRFVEEAKTALVTCMDVLTNLRNPRDRRLVVRSLMTFYEVYGDQEEEE